MAGINVTTSLKGALADNKVGGSRYLDVGTHKNVTIIEALDVELGAKKSPAVQLTFEAEDGRIAKHTVFYTQNVWENGAMTQETELSWDLRKLSGATVSDVEQREEMFGLFYAKTDLISHLVGFRLNIEIALPKKGISVQKSNNDEIHVIELSDGEVLSGDLIFDTFSEGVDWIKEQGLTKERAYTRVVGMTRLSLIDGKDVNGTAISAFIAAGNTKANAKGNVAPLGKRAGGSSI